MILLFLFELRVGLENCFSDAVLRCDVGDGAEERKTSPFPIDRVLAGRKRDVSAAIVGAAFPDREANQLKTG